MGSDSPLLPLVADGAAEEAGSDESDVVSVVQGKEESELPSQCPSGARPCPVAAFDAERASAGIAAALHLLRGMLPAEPVCGARGAAAADRPGSHEGSSADPLDLAPHLDDDLDQCVAGGNYECLYSFLDSPREDERVRPGGCSAVQRAAWFEYTGKASYHEGMLAVLACRYYVWKESCFRDSLRSRQAEAKAALRPRAWVPAWQCDTCGRNDAWRCERCNLCFECRCRCNDEFDETTNDRYHQWRTADIEWHFGREIEMARIADRMGHEGP